MQKWICIIDLFFSEADTKQIANILDNFTACVEYLETEIKSLFIHCFDSKQKHIERKTIRDLLLNER